MPFFYEKGFINMSHMEKISMILSEQAQQNALQLSLLMNIDRGSATEISINFT